jgi:hypothetical protein
VFLAERSRESYAKRSCVGKHGIMGSMGLWEGPLGVRIQITDYRLPIGPIKVGRPRGANLTTQCPYLVLFLAVIMSILFIDMMINHHIE